jgi:hydrogenase maturation factor
MKDSLSVVPEGVIAAKTGDVSAMHDITEGGIKGAVCEMCAASGKGAVINMGSNPVLDATRKICEYYGIDVYSLISSGSMLIAAKNGGEVAGLLNGSGIQATIIGRVTEKGVYDADTGEEIIPQSSDELYRVIENS